MTDNPYAHYTQSTGELRTYQNKNGYKQRQPYECMINVIWIADDIALLRGATGELSRPGIIAVAKTLYQQGARQLIIKRKKGKKLPFGQLTESTDVEDTYHVNLATIKGVTDE